MLGYAIGAGLYDTAGQWLINLYGDGAKIDGVEGDLIGTRAGSLILV